MNCSRCGEKIIFLTASIHDEKKLCFNCIREDEYQTDKSFVLKKARSYHVKSDIAWELIAILALTITVVAGSYFFFTRQANITLNGAPASSVAARPAPEEVGGFIVLDLSDVAEGDLAAGSMRGAVLSLKLPERETFPILKLSDDFLEEDLFARE